MKKHIVLAALVAVALTLLALGFVRSDLQLYARARQTPDTDSPSLREKARAKGQHVVFANPKGLRRYNDVAGLTGTSTLVVAGRVDDQTSRFRTAAESSIVTDSRVVIQDVLKGEAAPGQVITVREPGGRVQFEDGTWAEVKMPEYWRSPESGSSYIFFLKKTGNVHMLFGGPQGLFEIASDGTVEPHVRPEDELTRKYKGKRIAEFLDEIRLHTNGR